MNGPPMLWNEKDYKGKNPRADRIPTPDHPLPKPDCTLSALVLLALRGLSCYPSAGNTTQHIRERIYHVRTEQSSVGILF